MLPLVEPTGKPPHHHAWQDRDPAPIHLLRAASPGATLSSSSIRPVGRTGLAPRWNWKKAMLPARIGCLFFLAHDLGAHVHHMRRCRRRLGTGQDRGMCGVPTGNLNQCCTGSNGWPGQIAHLGWASL
jgi:hypothetical protein